MGSTGSETARQSNPAFANPWAIAMLQSAGGQVFPNYTIDPTTGKITTGPMNPYPTGLNYQNAPFTDAQNQAFGLTEGQTGTAGGLAGTGAGYTQGILGQGGALAGYGANVLNGQGGLQSFQNSALGQQAGLNTYGSNVLSGQFLNPSSNPNLQNYANQAGSVLSNQYALGTAPSLMAQAIGMGGGGPGALAGNANFQQQQWANQYGLGQNLANQNANIYNSAYNTGIGQMESAYGTGVGQATSVFGAGLGQQESTYGTGIAQQENALGLLPSTQSSLYTPSNQLLGIGGLQQQQQQNILNTNQQNFAQQTNWPWQQLQNLGSIFGTSIGNAGTSTVQQSK